VERAGGGGGTRFLPLPGPLEKKKEIYKVLKRGIGIVSKNIFFYAEYPRAISKLNGLNLR
jgi:hypothetical protein